MARRSMRERNVRKLTKVGGTSYSVTIPIEMIKKLKWRERQRLVVKRSGKKVIIQDWPAGKK